MSLSASVALITPKLEIVSNFQFHTIRTLSGGREEKRRERSKDMLGKEGTRSLALVSHSVAPKRCKKVFDYKEGRKKKGRS
jgi:hypothetical protein